MLPIVEYFDDLDFEIGGNANKIGPSKAIMTISKSYSIRLILNHMCMSSILLRWISDL